MKGALDTKVETEVVELSVGRLFHTTATLVSKVDFRSLNPIFGPKGADAFVLYEGLFVKIGAEEPKEGEINELPIVRVMRPTTRLYAIGKLPGALAFNGTRYILKRYVELCFEKEDLEEVVVTEKQIIGQEVKEVVGIMGEGLGDLIKKIEELEKIYRKGAEHLGDITTEFLRERREMAEKALRDGTNLYKGTAMLLEEYRLKLPPGIMDALEALLQAENECAELVHVSELQTKRIRELEAQKK